MNHFTTRGAVGCWESDTNNIRAPSPRGHSEMKQAPFIVFSNRPHPIAPGINPHYK